jgi:hypothetical protein
MEEWFLNYGVDGFRIQRSHLPGGLADFIELVIPEFRERGLFRTEYDGTTLRDHLGLSRPRGRYAWYAACDVHCLKEKPASKPFHLAWFANLTQGDRSYRRPGGDPDVA